MFRGTRAVARVTFKPCELVKGRQNFTRNYTRTSATMASMADRITLPARFGKGEKSVWVEYIQLVADYKPAVNLGQGFPDYHAPSHVTKGLSDLSVEDNPLNHQYTRGFGHPRLVKALSDVYSPLIGHKIDPFNEILVTIGAYQALYAAILGHVEEGDEVIVIEPFYDCYDFQIKSAGGVPKFIALKPKSTGDNMTSSDWVLDPNELASLFTPKTKMIVVNTPHNPLGKVFSREELTVIADLCKKHNVICLSDEVYEWMVYKPKEHIRIATLPGMWERTITVGSAGKTFSVTGWKIGWAYAPHHLMKNLHIVHQNCVYTCATPLQEAVARSFEFELSRVGSPECYLESLARELQPKRDYLVRVLRENGFNPTVPEAGYFVVADWTKLASKIDLSSEPDPSKDYKFTKKFAKEASVLAIPPTAFYSQEHKHLGEDYVRFCYIKKDENLQLTEKLFKEWHAKKKSIVTNVTPKMASQTVHHSRSQEDNQINLAESDFLAPEYVRKTLAEVAVGDPMLHQYTAGFGHPRLKQNVAKVYSPLIGREINPSTEILITSGANEALLTAFLSTIVGEKLRRALLLPMNDVIAFKTVPWERGLPTTGLRIRDSRETYVCGFVERGDEVIVIEPFYEGYVPLIKSAGGIPRYVPLRLKKNVSGAKIPSSSDWTLDTSELASAFNSHTKMLMLNNPHHPLGKVYSWGELEGIAALCREYDVMCVADEIWEWMVYEGKHHRIATLPGMWERSITICSAGKTFLAPGWRVGWAYGPAPFIHNLKEIYLNSSYTPLQEAVACLLESQMPHNSSENHFSLLPRELQLKKSHFIKILKDHGFCPITPEAGYFLIARKKHQDLAKTLNEHLATIPLERFYCEEHKALAEDFITMCFLQKEETLSKFTKYLAELS